MPDEEYDFMCFNMIMFSGESLANKMTKKSSLQTYYTIKFLVDKNLVDDAYKAYAYYRWLDDQIDVGLEDKSTRTSFIKRQKLIIDKVYSNKVLPKLRPEEKMIAELIKTDTQSPSKLTSFIRNFFSVIEFDACRKDRNITKKELEWYSKTIGKAVTDCIQYFIGHNENYPVDKNQYLAATAAHIVHMLRDYREDIIEGFLNIPKEISKANQSAWVKKRVELAKDYFKLGKIYIGNLKNLKCKLAALGYCARFEGLLTKIERDNFRL